MRLLDPSTVDRLLSAESAQELLEALIATEREVVARTR
jgi:hypothetical protein